MKNVLHVTLCLAAVVILTGLAGCYGPGVSGSNNVIEKEYALTGFSRVEVSSTFRADIIRSDTYRVAVKTSDNLFDYVDISVTGDTLHIRLRPFINFRFAQFHATVALPDLKVVDITGASYGAVSGFNSAGAVEVKVSGASRLDLSSLNSTDLLTEVSGASRLTGSLEAQKADFEVSGASTVELSGATENVRMEVSGASTARMDSLKTTNADITLSGASNATINVTGKLDLQVSGASRLVYTGSAVLGRAEVTGASTLTKR